jgi:hypothetical protein
MAAIIGLGPFIAPFAGVLWVGEVRPIPCFGERARSFPDEVVRSEHGARCALGRSGARQAAELSVIHGPARAGKHCAQAGRPE